MPALIWLQLNGKADPSIGVAYRNLIQDVVRDGAVKILMVVGGAQILFVHVPMGEHLAPAYNVVRAYFKEIRKVGVDSQLKQEFDFFAGIIGHIKVLVDTLAHPAINCYMQRLRFYRSVL